MQTSCKKEKIQNVRCSCKQNNIFESLRPDNKQKPHPPLHTNTTKISQNIYKQMTSDAYNFPWFSKQYENESAFTSLL